MNPPKIQAVRDVRLPEYQLKEYDSGMRLIIVDAGTQPVFKLEATFTAGRFYEHKPLVAATTAKMIREGAGGYSSEEIAEFMDFHGATLSAPTSLDYSTLALYGLNEHFETLLPVYRAVLLHPAFPEKDFKSHITERKQRMQVDLSKNDIVAYRNVTEAIFGDRHPYGYNSNAERYGNLTVADLRKHHQAHYRAGNCLMVLSGKVSHGMLEVLERELFPHIPLGYSEPRDFERQSALGKRLHFERPHSVQTAIRIGRRLFTRQHGDYLGLYFLNVILGDYFSSRLMVNLREDKGYTYNVYSMLDIMRRDGIFLIATEMANEYVEDGLLQIRVEFERLREELVSDAELEMARNYTLGTLLTTIDGAFHAANTVKGIRLNGLGDEAFAEFVHTIKTIGAGELRELARKYLNWEEMFVVTVGKGKEC